MNSEVVTLSLMPQNLQINIQYYVTEGLERIYETFRLLLKILRERDVPKDEVKINNFFSDICRAFNPMPQKPI